MPLDTVPSPEKLTRLGQFRLSGRHFRIVLALACFLLAALVGVIHLMNVSTSDAVLDGRRIVIRSEIDGEVLGPAPNVGDTVGKGDIVATVQARLTDRRPVQAVQAERDEVEARIVALDAQSETLETLQQQLRGEVTEFNKAALDSVRAEVDSAQSNIQAMEADYKVAQAEAQRARQMRNTGGMGGSDIDRRLGTESELTQRLAAARAELIRLQTQAGAFAHGINPRDGQNNVPYSRQRLDEISIRLGDIANQRATLAARDASLIAETNRENTWLSSQTKSQSRSPGQAVVWQRPVAVGTDVAKGDTLVELVDCSDMFVTARIPANKASVIALGDEVHVQVAGFDDPVPGKVRIVRGISQADPRGSEASGLQAPGMERWAEVEIAVDRKNIPSTTGNLCGIGSGARVRFPVRSIFSSLLPNF